MRLIRGGIWALVGLGIVIQVVPYGRDHRNPPQLREPEWDQPGTRELFFRACKDCHSNQTEWPWYSVVAPVSWLVQSDVEDGRSHFNISEWGRENNHGDDAAELVREGKMPPWFYLPAHPEAQLTDREREDFIAGLEATFAEDDGEGAHDHHAHDHDH